MSLDVMEELPSESDAAPEDADDELLTNIRGAMEARVGQWTCRDIHFAFNGDVLVISGTCDLWSDYKTAQDIAMFYVREGVVVRNDLTVRSPFEVRDNPPSVADGLQALRTGASASLHEQLG